MIKLRFRPFGSARDKTAAIVASIVCILFIVGAVHFYHTPVELLLGYLLNLVVILVVLILLALGLAGLIVLLKKLFSDKP